MSSTFEPGGFTFSMTVDFNGINTLSSGLSLHLLRIDIVNYQHYPEEAELNFCSSLGSPVVENTLWVDGEQFEPTFNVPSAMIRDYPPESYRFSIEADAVIYDVVTGDSDPLQASLITQDQSLLADRYLGLASVFMGVSHNSNLLTPVSVNPSNYLQDVNLGAGPSWWYPTLESNGITLTATFERTIFAEPHAVAVVEYEINPTYLLGETSGVTTELQWVDGLGLYSLVNSVGTYGSSSIGSGTTGSGTSVLPDELTGHTVQLHASSVANFSRGDCNGDGSFDIGDGIKILFNLFQADIAHSCLASCDSNSDNANDIADAIYLFAYLFTDGSEPSAPFPNCDSLLGSDCATSPCP